MAEEHSVDNVLDFFLDKLLPQHAAESVGESAMTTMKKKMMMSLKTDLMHSVKVRNYFFRPPTVSDILYS